MLIDWFTVVAQVLNFLILVWLLKRFLYRPILNAIDVREKRIAAEVADANTKKAEAEKDRDAFEAKNKAFDEQRGALLKKATEAAAVERERLLVEARKSVEALNETQHAALQADASRLSQALRDRVQQEVFAITRKALVDLASTSLEERLAEVFVRRLGTLDDTMKKTLTQAISVSSDAAVVRSALDLPAAQQATIQKALDDAFATDVHVRFETAPALISGIELAAGGQKLGWTIAGYLASLNQCVDEVLARPSPLSSPTPAPTPTPTSTTTPAQSNPAAVTKT
ncbi:F0F1 ATP synthase subunit delta [Rhodanobacter sp. AS-Z3]|uniref:F0F1 ATP synthase subunit delta n=1 Tax=Rhodanobacter sp. AS-Z3 TaxID=3031330 RepID=UPI00247A16CC|nr:F0F1 ATP synthase subunit delta [Rhodanobacter sp. AS-Z3]WEN16575.1 F0F1 ATP synthase subunit delta [Rhodanobacter sp. AS-Z3]